MRAEPQPRKLRGKRLPQALLIPLASHNRRSEDVWRNVAAMLHIIAFASQ
jgi:hypothetical protein